MPAVRRKSRKKASAKKKVARAKREGARRKATSRPAAESRPELSVEAASPERSLEARLRAPLEQMERMLEAFRRRGWLSPSSFDWSRWTEPPPEGRFPSIDVVNKDKEIQIRAEVPGIERDDLFVTVTDRTLTISGESRHEEESEEGELHRHEIRRGSFSRTLTLPEDVDGGKAKASYRDGVLKLRLPKLRRSKKHAVKLD